MSITVTSSAFKEGESIPVEYTEDGEDVSPPLRWTNPPAGVKTFALICEDPDAPRGTFTHWVLFDLPADTRELKEAIPDEPVLPDGATQGMNDFKKAGYAGPAPPPGKPHRYFFRLYALDHKLALPPRAVVRELRDEMEGHILDEGHLMGTYGRQPGVWTPPPS